MKRLQAFKFELRANGGRQRQFNYTKLANFLPTWKQEMPWLRQSTCR
jgi:hypothetical protein